MSYQKEMHITHICPLASGVNLDIAFDIETVCEIVSDIFAAHWPNVPEITIETKDAK